MGGENIIEYMEIIDEKHSCQVCIEQNQPDIKCGGYMFINHEGTWIIVCTNHGDVAYERLSVNKEKVYVLHKCI